MKKQILIAVILAFISITSHAQISYGKFVMFPDAKLTGSMWKPQIDFMRLNEQDIIGIRTCASDTYHSFDSDSRVLLKFADSTTVKLPIIEEIEIQKDYKSTLVSSVVFDNFITFSFYEIDDETVDKIVNARVPIIKIRLVFTNGNIKDYDIPTKYQAKLIEGLIFSRDNAIAQNQQRAANESDADF